MIRPLILSGGGGTRLWPLSRSGNPKQFHRLFGEESLLQATAQRCRGDQFRPPLIATAEDQRFFVVSQLEEAGIAPDAVLLEPAPRNTAPAIAAAAFWAIAQGEDEPLLVMPSDHLIKDGSSFRAAIQAALPAALSGKLVTFGIPATRPHTGYGYIQAAEAEPGAVARKVQRFVEKPDARRAAEFVSDVSYFWNSGIFLFRPSAFLRELELHAPHLAVQIEKAMSGARADGRFVRPDAEAFAAAENISIDYAVMERSREVLMVPAAFDWSDVGSWDAVREHLLPDESGNVLSGDVVAIDVNGSLIRSDSDVTVAAVGLDRMLCIVTADAVFVAPLDRADEVKQVVERLRSKGQARADEPAQVHRPWGTYQIVDRGEGFQTKRLVVKPGGKLSLQTHARRSEHWVVVKGSAQVTLGDETRLLRENESVHIPAGARHRLANPGDVPLHIIEVQCGDYLGEDDIVRIDDDYGRTDQDGP